MAFSAPSNFIKKTNSISTQLRGRPQKAVSSKPDGGANKEGLSFDNLDGAHFEGASSASIATEAPLRNSNPKMKVEQIFTLAQLATGDWASSSCGDLHHWNGSYWAIVDEFELGSAAWVWLSKYFETEACDATAIRCVRTLKLTPYKLPKQQSKRIVIACEDFYLEVARIGREMKLMRIEPDQALGFTSCVPVRLNGLAGEEYTPQGMAAAPMLAAFLESSMPAADVRAVVQDYIGYTLIPPSVLNLGISLVMVGRGGDGKGLLSSVTSQILHRHSTMAIDLGAKDGFSLEGIEASISLATVDELPINEAILSKDLKSAISCDSMSINRKGRKRLTVRPTARFMMGGNDLPRFDHGGAAALERRFIFVPFGARLSSTDRVANLENIIIEDESQSFLDWALIGALRVAERRVFDFAKLPDICRKMSGEAIEATDSTLGFIKEFAVGPSTAVMNKEKVYNDYLGWMSTERRGTHPLASQNFFKRLLSHLNVGEIEAPRGSELGRPRKVYLAYDQFPEVNAAPAAAAPSKTESATDDKPPFDD